MSLERELADIDVLCIYGAGHRYEEYKPWLLAKQERFLIYIEEDPQTLERLTRTTRGREILNNSKVRLTSLQGDREEIFKQLAWEFVFLRISYAIEPGSDKKKWEEIVSRMSYYQRCVNLVASDYSDRGSQVFRNVCGNLERLHLAKPARELFSQFKGVPAIICGAGPSLAKNVDLLKQFSSNALIFAGGTAVNVLSHHGVIPHFCAHVDPNPPYRRFANQEALEVPLLYQNRLNSDLLSLSQSQILWMSDNGGYPIESWASEKLGLWSEPFDGGWTVGNFCVAAAHAFGCNPIILVGMDFGTKDENLYAPGVSESREGHKLNALTDIYGEKIYSKSDWIIAAQWIEEFADRNPSCWINATEGGIGFKGILNEPLSKVGNEHLKCSYDLKGMVHSAIVSLEAAVQEGNSSQILKEIKDSLTRCYEGTQKLLSALEKIFPNLPFENGEYLLAEFEMQEEIASKKVLEPLWLIWKHVFARQIPAEQKEMGLLINKILFFKNVIENYWQEHGKRSF